MHLAMITYTSDDDENIKGALIYDNYVLTRAFLHPTFVDAFWTDLSFKCFAASGDMDLEGTLQTLEEADLDEVQLGLVPEEFQRIKV